MITFDKIFTERGHQLATSVKSFSESKDPLSKFFFTRSIQARLRATDLELDRFLNDTTYDMDDRDSTGWLIYHQLMDFHHICKRTLERYAR